MSDWHLGRTILAARTVHGLTQRTLATQLGVSQSAVGQWELGQTRPGRDMIPKLSAALGIPIELLYQTELAGEPLHPDAAELAVRANRLDHRTRRALLTFVDAWLAGNDQ